MKLICDFCSHFHEVALEIKIKEYDIFNTTNIGLGPAVFLANTGQYFVFPFLCCSSCQYASTSK